MKNFCKLLLMVGFVSCTGNDRSEPVVQEQITKQEVHLTIQKWAQAMLENQLEPQVQLLDDTWIYSGSDDGTTTDKKKALAGFKPGETSLKGIMLQDTMVRLYGDVAIVTGKEELLFVEENDTNRLHLRFTDVFIKKEGSIRALSTHSSPIKINEDQN